MNRLSLLSAFVLASILTSAGCTAAVEASNEDVLSDDTLTTQSGLTWEQFQKVVFREPGTGVYIADGDTPFFSDKQLREFYDTNVAQGQLIVNRVGSTDDVWNNTQRQNLSYCVSSSFGSNKSKVVEAMANATDAWMAAANVKFTYVPAQDDNCVASNTAVLFDVNPVSVGGQYLARAFFPSTARRDRNVLIDGSAFSSTGTNFIGVLRHELGHTLGFRHEHTRPESGACFEDSKWRSVTGYDASSVMHYPQCNGKGSFESLALTAMDKQGASALYGAPDPTPTPVPTPVPTPAPGTTVENLEGRVATSQTKAFGPFAVVPGSDFDVELTGSGDADLYVRFGSAPTATAYACRPYLDGSDESCALTVPPTANTAYVTVVGYTASTFKLKVQYKKLLASTGGTKTGIKMTDTTVGSVVMGKADNYQPVDVLEGTVFNASLSGSGDPDLYIGFDSAPTLTQFACRPYKEGPIEACSVTVPKGATKAYLMIYGYAAASYTLKLDWTAVAEKAGG
ncbi:MAG: M57 family metalloprotease [Myxococcaceae bacterium]